MQPARQRLSDRRHQLTENIEVGSQTYTASAGIDPDVGNVREVFLCGAKEGSEIDNILGDTAVVISVALQHGVPIDALARSVARTRTTPIQPSELDGGLPLPTIPVSVIGRALDFLQDIQNELRG